MFLTLEECDFGYFLAGFHLTNSLSLFSGRNLLSQGCAHCSYELAHEALTSDKWPRSLDWPSSSATDTTSLFSTQPPFPLLPDRALVTWLENTGWATRLCTASPAGSPTCCVWSYVTGKATRPPSSMSSSSWAVRSSGTGGLGAQACGWCGGPRQVAAESAPWVIPWASPISTIWPLFGRTSWDLEVAA